MRLRILFKEIFKNGRCLHFIERLPFALSGVLFVVATTLNLSILSPLLLDMLDRFIMLHAVVCIYWRMAYLDFLSPSRNASIPSPLYS